MATDDELFELAQKARGRAIASGKHVELYAAERRALYEAGEKAGAEYEAKRCGHTDVDWLLTDEAQKLVMRWELHGNDMLELLNVLHDRIAEGGR